MKEIAPSLESQGSEGDRSDSHFPEEGECCQNPSQKVVQLHTILLHLRNIQGGIWLDI